MGEDLQRVRLGLNRPQGELATFDDEARLPSAQREIAKWVFDNVAILPMYKVNWVFPLGPQIDSWDMACCDARVLFDLEYIPHRQN